MTCSCCHQTINRGDAITQILGNQGALRPRGLKKDERSYTPTRNKWVHLHCRPSHWYTYGWSPMFCAGFTRYSNSIERRRDAASLDPDWGENYWEIPNPVWKLEQEHIEKGVVATFQALWRGYTTRKKYRAVKWIIANSSSYADMVVDWFVRYSSGDAYKWLPRIAAAVQIQRIWRGYKIRKVLKRWKRRIREEEIRRTLSVIKQIKSIDDYDLCPNLMIRLNKLRLTLRKLHGVEDMIVKYIKRRVFYRGVRVIFNRGESCEKIWSGKIIHGEHNTDGKVFFTVLYSDGDRRTYSDAKLNLLLDECHYIECERADELSVCM